MTREEAINIVQGARQYLTAGNPIWDTEKVDEAMKLAIEALSAEAVQGEWIDIDNYYRLATCSHCNKVTMFEKWGEYTKPYNFCPNCGARMKGGESE